MTKGIWIALGLTMGSVSFAQVELTGPQQFPQFRGMSGLPGGGSAIRFDGSVGKGGAMALSTPVAYSLGNWKFVFGLSLLSIDGAIPPFSSTGSGATFLNSNGTATQAVGIHLTGDLMLTITNFIASTVGDSTTNYHLSYPIGNGASFAAGVQDITGEIGSAGDTFSPAEDGRSSRSFYAVATFPLGEKSFVSAGIGSLRFKRPFFNASTWVTDNVILFVEQDGYNWNGGFGWDLGGLGFEPIDDEANLFLHGGTVRGKYPFVGFAVSF